MILKQFGGVENFSLETVPTPEPKQGEVLVRVKAIGIDQIDIKTRKGVGMTDFVKDEHPMILGWDISGVVEKLGDGVQDLKVGDEVFGSVNFPGPGSSYAEYAVAPTDQLAIKPENISHAEAAAATQSPLTAWQAIVDAGHVGKGDRVLIHGGAGGVGNYAVQIAKHLGAHVTATASGSDESFVKELGAEEVIDYKTQKFDEILHDMDFILDTIGGENFARSLSVLKPDGTIVLLPSNKKAEADKVAEEKHVRNYKHVKVHSNGEDMREIAKMLREGTMKVHVDKTYPLDRLPEAHEQLENGKVKGKIAVTVE